MELVCVDIFAVVYVVAAVDSIDVVDDSAVVDIIVVGFVSPQPSLITPSSLLGATPLVKIMKNDER